MVFFEWNDDDIDDVRACVGWVSSRCDGGCIVFAVATGWDARRRRRDGGKTYLIRAPGSARLTNRRFRSAGGSGDGDETILFADGMKSQIQQIAREVYDDSPALANAQVMLSWRPTTKKKDDPNAFAAELTNQIKSQKETLKQLLQHKDEMTAKCQAVERSYKVAMESAKSEVVTTTVPATAEEMAQIKAERERLAKQKEETMAHLNNVQEAEEELQRKIDALNEERAKIREEEHGRVLTALAKKIADAEARVQAAETAEASLARERGTMMQLREMENVSAAEAGAAAAEAKIAANMARDEARSAQQALLNAQAALERASVEHEMLSNKYAEEKATWDSELAALTQSESNLKIELNANLSKLEGMTAQYNQLASEAARQNASAQEDIEKIVAAMTMEKEKALSDLEETLTREKSEELHSLERQFRSRLEHEINALKSESKEDMQQRIVSLNALLAEQKANNEITLSAFKAEAGAKEAGLKAEFLAALKDAEHRAELASAKATSALESLQATLEQVKQSAQEELTRVKQEAERALAEQAKKMSEEHAMDKAKALEAQQLELQSQLLSERDSALNGSHDAHAAAMSELEIKVRQECAENFSLELRSEKEQSEARIQQAQAALMAEKERALQAQRDELSQQATLEREAAIVALKEAHEETMLELTNNLKAELEQARMAASMGGNKTQRSDAEIKAIMEVEKQTALVTASEKHADVLARKIQELTEKLSADKHAAVSALEREKYELMANFDAKHNAALKEQEKVLRAQAEADKMTALENLRTTLQLNASGQFEAIKAKALEEQREKFLVEKQIALDNLKAELTVIKDAAIAQAKAEAAASDNIDASRSYKAAIEKLRVALESEKQEALALQAAKLSGIAEAQREHAMTELRAELQAAASREKHDLITELQSFSGSARTKEMIELEQKAQRVLMEANEREAKLHAEITRLTREKEEARRLEAAATSAAAMMHQPKSDSAAADRMKVTIASLESKVRSLERDGGKQGEMAKMQAEMEHLRKEAAAANRRAQQVKDEHVASFDRVKELEAQLLEADELRREMHNMVQELRGNVRVIARVRPLLPGEDNVVEPIDKETLAVSIPELDPRLFSFDRVFNERSTQEEVFEEVSELVQSALDGYKVCLFSYGQTGSGKTHTMLGTGEGERRGIIPRAVAKVLEQAEALRSKGYEYTMEASYVEIYNEQIRDLLCPGAVHSERHSVVSSPEGGCPTVTGVVREEVTSVYEATSLVRRAMNARAVEATEMNANSSRSHTLFLLYITGVHAATGQTLTGCLNLVDLAGSERTKRSGAAGQRMTEACAINKSLSCLGDVFAAVGRGDKHIPYRNSKLTYLLAPCLGGEGKTLMVVNIAPDLDSAEESMCSLRFASTVNAVELGNGKKAKRNIAQNLAHLTTGGAEVPTSSTMTRSRRSSASALPSREMYDRRSSAGTKRGNPFGQNERAPKTRRKAWE